MNTDMIRVNIRALLKKKNMTLYKLAKDTGLAYTTLWKLEKGQTHGVTFEVMEKVCLHLKCSPADLFIIEK